MSEIALAGWEQVHDPVEPAIVMWSVLVLASMGSYGYMLSGTPVAGAYFYIFRVQLAVILGHLALTSCFFWHHGQPYFDTLAFKTTTMASSLCFICVMIVGYLCPLEAVPFGSTVHLTLVLAAIVWMQNVILGLAPMAIPAEPCRKLVLPLMQALPRTLRLMDACTDLSLLRVLAVQVCVLM